MPIVGQPTELVVVRKSVRPQANDALRIRLVVHPSCAQIQRQVVAVAAAVPIAVPIAVGGQGIHSGAGDHLVEMVGFSLHASNIWCTIIPSSV